MIQNAHPLVGDATDDELSPALQPIKPPLILLVEDDEDMRGDLAFILRRGGFAVIEVQNGKQLVDYFAPAGSAGGGRLAPDLILSDIRMPGCSGMEALATLRRAANTIPVIMMTAFGDTRTHDEARQLGAIGVLDKPFDIDDLVTAILWALRPAVAPTR